MKNNLFTILVFFLLSTLSIAQEISVKIAGNIFNANRDSIKISQFYGTHYVDFIKGKLDKKGNYSLSGKLPAEDFYVLRLASNQHINLILRNNSMLTINADGKNLTRGHVIVGSQESSDINEFVQKMQAIKVKQDTANAMIKRSPENQESINQSFSTEYFNFMQFRQQYINAHQNSAALVPVLSTIDVNKEFAMYESIVRQAVPNLQNSATMKAVQQEYNARKSAIDAANFLAVGKLAPDFSQADINGNQLSLFSLRGKVVLLDFWASWCGPCRGENPNVVKLYEKYKDAGFTVMSVSLDQDKQKWLAAIEKDKLAWPNHVSDLKQWSNEAAKLYQVTGIPFTVLLDAEGKVIGTKLRGQELENALKIQFGF
jgi:thiol-disulfide isomerase/thioredoxin